MKTAQDKPNPPPIFCPVCGMDADLRFREEQDHDSPGCTIYAWLQCPRCGTRSREGISYRSFKDELYKSWATPKSDARADQDKRIADLERQNAELRARTDLLENRITHNAHQHESEANSLRAQLAAAQESKQEPLTGAAAFTEKAMVDVVRERGKQDSKWGEQNHDPFTYLTILGEEYGELCQAALHLKFGGPASRLIREEAVQIAAVAVAIIECLDRAKWQWSTPPAASLETVVELLKEARLAGCHGADPNDCPLCAALDKVHAALGI